MAVDKSEKNMEPSSPQGTTTLDNAPESNNTLVICDQNHVLDNMTEEIPKLNTILNSNLSVHDSIDPPPHTQQDSSTLGVNNNPSNPLFNDQLSRFSKLKQVYTSSRSLWLIHSISLFYVLYSCMTVYLSLNQIYNVSAKYQHEWVKTNDFPSKIVGEGIYTSVKNFNQPKLEISEPLNNSVKNSFQTMVFDFSIHLDHLKLRDKDPSKVLPFSLVQLSFVNNGPCFFNHTIMVDNSSHSHFTISQDGKELFLNHLKVDLPFNSGNHECSNFKTLPSHLHFHIALEDSEKNRVVYKYHYPIWANHFMGSYQMAMSRLGWEPIRIAVIGNPKWGKSTFVNELGDFTSIDDHRIQLVSDVGLGVQNDHATRMVRRFCLWQEGKFAKLPLSVCVQDPPGSNVGVMDKVPQYIEYLVKQKITPDEDIITECTLNPHSCLKKYEHHPEQLPDVIVYMIPFGMIEKSKESITPNLQYFHKLQIPVILVVTTGEERKLSVIHDEINKLQGYNYHSVVISNEHYELNAPKSPEVIRRVAQILREVFDLVQSKRGVLQTWKVIVKKVFSEVWNQYGMIMLTMTMANVMWLFMLIFL